MTSTSSRIPAMDVLRGCAVMGILWMNVTSFAWPQGAYFNPRVTGPVSAGDMAVWIVSLLLFDGKMRALFSMLFGASMLLLIDREEMAGRDGRRAQTIRAAWLFILGLAHYLLLWRGDILMLYALVGLAALPFAGREPISLVKWAFLFFLIHFILCAGFILGLYGWAAEGGTGFADYIASFSDPRAPSIVEEIALYRSGFLTIAHDHLRGYPGDWLWNLPFTALEALGFMLLGMAMLKSGFLTGRWEAEQYWRTARHCFMIGLIPMAALALWIAASGFDGLPALGTGLAWAFPFRIPLAVGWAALILWAFRRCSPHQLTHRLGAAGRLALSNYLGSSILMCALFYGWGLGLFAHVDLMFLPLFAMAIWCIMLIWSPRWERRFALGPAEWLWRSLYRRRPQKIRKSS